MRCLLADFLFSHGEIYMKRIGALLLAGYACLTLLVNPGMAGEYSPPGLYDAEHYVLDNGLRVILRPRGGAHTVSFRVAVGVGQHDYDCGWQETPHFLEHLLFTGTSRHSEAELEEIVEQHGGYWNAYTAAEETVYELDIYSRYAGFGLDVLNEILTDSLLSAEDVETSRGIIEREAGGRPTAIRQWMYRHDVGRTATDKALRQIFPESNYICAELEAAAHITRDDILEAYRAYYVPGNMALIVVGDFDADDMRHAIVDSFGSQPATSPPERPFPVPPPTEVFGEVQSTLQPILGSDAEVGMAFRAVGMTSADYYALHVLQSYLDSRLYEIVRIESGLAYSPASELGALRDYGVLLVYADVELEAQDRVLGLMRQEIERLQEPLDNETVELAKRKLLLRMVQGYESNSELADYYADSVFEYAASGRLVDQELRVEQVTAEDLHRVARQYLSPDRAVVYREVPTLTYSRFYAGLLLLVLVMAGGAALLFHRRWLSGRSA
jgi:predicted Zn-dependent peptidase